MNVRSYVLLLGFLFAFQQPALGLQVKFSDEQLLDIAKSLRGVTRPSNQYLFQQEFDQEDPCGTPEAVAIAQGLMDPDVSAPTKDEIGRLFIINGRNRRFDTTNFSINYTIDATEDQVIGADRDQATTVVLPTGTRRTIANNGIPDYVEKLSIYLEYSLDRLLSSQYGFRRPESLGRIDVDIENISVLGFVVAKITIDNDIRDDVATGKERIIRPFAQQVVAQVELIKDVCGGCAGRDFKVADLAGASHDYG